MTFRQLWARLHALWHRGRKESELDAEIRFHLSEEADRRVAEGASPKQARHDARKDFGNVIRIREAMREAWGLTWVEVATKSVFRNALRNVWRSPRLSLAAVLCIGLAMAATSAALTLVTATLLRPLPYRDAERLVRVWLEETGEEPRIALSYPELVELDEHLTGFDELEATARARIQFRSDQGSRRVEGEAVTAGYFDLLGVEPFLGRSFTDDEHRGRSNRVLLLSYASWSVYHGHDPDILGRQLLTDQGSYEVVGVLPSTFSGTVEDDSGDIEFWVPITQYLDVEARERRDLRLIWTIGHLASQASIDSVRAEVATLSTELTRLFPESYRARTFAVEPLGENWRSSIRQGSLLLLAAAILVLVVAAANVALLLLARSIDNQKHWALRMALGAGRFDVVRLAATETAILVGAGSALGLLIGPPALRAFLNQPSIADGSIVGVPVFVRFTVDPVVAGSCALFFLLVALIAAMGPALHCLRLDVNHAIRDTSRSHGGRTGRRWFRAMALTEVALTTVLTIGASLLVRSYSGLLNQELGFRTHEVLRIGLFVNEADVVDESALPSFSKRVRETVLAEPGVRAMGVIWPTIPIDWPLQASFRAPGLEPTVTEEDDRVDHFVADPHAFETLGMRLVAGRDFAETDEPEGAPVGIVNRALALRIAGTGDAAHALGVEADLDGHPFRIVGVIDDVRLGGPKEPAGSRHRVFLPFSQTPQRMMSLFILTDGDPEALVAPLRRRLAAVAPSSALDWIGPVDELIGELFLRDTRFMLSLLGAFTLAGMFLSATGLFAVLADSVARRRGEIGLRQALGASPSQVLVAILAEALSVVAVGMGLGMLLAWLWRQALASLLHGVSPSDPWSHAGALAVMTSVALLAAIVPALRAAAIDPADALRDG